MADKFPKNEIRFLQKQYMGVFKVGDYESGIKFSHNKMADDSEKCYQFSPKVVNGVFEVADYESDIKFSKNKIPNPKQ